MEQIGSPSFSAISWMGRDQIGCKNFPFIVPLVIHGRAKIVSKVIPGISPCIECTLYNPNWFLLWMTLAEENQFRVTMALIFQVKDPLQMC